MAFTRNRNSLVGIATWAAAGVEARAGPAGADLFRRRSRGWGELSAADGAGDRSVRRHCKSGSTEALPQAAFGRDRFGIAWTDPRSATSAEQAGIGVAVYIRMDSQPHPCVLVRPAKRDSSQARGVGHVVCVRMD